MCATRCDTRFARNADDDEIVGIPNEVKTSLVELPI